MSSWLTGALDRSIRFKYFRDPEATKKAFRGGYFATGDLAVMNEDGSISIRDRSKDIIISGGEVTPFLGARTRDAPR